MLSKSLTDILGMNLCLDVWVMNIQVYKKEICPCPRHEGI
jgi:hypothetical protein